MAELMDVELAELAIEQQMIAFFLHLRCSSVQDYAAILVSLKS